MRRLVSILFVLLLAGCGSAAPEAATATAEPSVTAAPVAAAPKPTRTPAPTATAAPSATPEPTRTPRPTNTPRPTRTPAPTITVDVAAEADAAYRGFALSTARDFSAALGAFGEINAEMGEDPALLFDDGWKLRAAAAVTMVQLAADRVIEAAIAVPEGRQAFHARYVEAATLYRDAMDDYVAGVDGFDIERLLAATEKLAEANGIISELNAQLNE